MTALRRAAPAIEFEIFTTVPRWFFQDTLGEGFEYREFSSDVGLVQNSPFSENIPATIEQLIIAKETSHSQIKWAADRLKTDHASLIICDISSIGIQAAKAAALPAVLVENFTWDYIYAGYTDGNPALMEFIPAFGQVYDWADLHIQAVPVCRGDAGSIQVNPISRQPLSVRNEVRDQLGVGTADRMILVTMGGIEKRYDALESLKTLKNIVFVIPGSSHTFERADNLILLPHRSRFYHPDLVAASDAVIGKLGYSTLAEAYQAGVPYAYIPRESFPETPTMAEFARREMAAIEMPLDDFISGKWNDLPARLLAVPKVNRTGQNGADQAAEGILSRYD